MPSLRKELTKLIILVVVASVLLIFAFSLSKTDLSPTPEDSNQSQADKTLRLPEGFSIEVFAGGLPGVRVMEFDGMGNMWVSQTQRGVVSLIEIDDGGGVLSKSEVFRNLNRPHGLAIDPADGFTLYIAQTDKISKALLYADAPVEKIIDLLGGGRHFTRTIGFGPDLSNSLGQERLYVSIGSSCDVCIEEDERRAAIYSLEKDGNNFAKFASGLRNAVFFAWHPVTQQVWATEMGRDHLGDDLPPDEINIVLESNNHGWPFCYGNQVRDNKFEPSIEFDCGTTQSSHINIPAHSSPLGLAFIPENPPTSPGAGQAGGWPQEWQYDLLVAYHGSWNRSEKTGYKVVRIPLDSQGRQEGEIEDFISGWLTQSGEVIGRPVDIIVRPEGVIYISDDHAGVIYKITYTAEK